MFKFPFIIFMAFSAMFPVIAMERMPEMTEHRQQVGWGKTFIVSLPSSPSSGDVWRLRSLPEPLSLVDYEYQPDENCEPRAAGCSGKQIYTFLADGYGHGTIVFYYSPVYQNAWSERVWLEQVEITVSSEQK